MTTDAKKLFFPQAENNSVRKGLIRDVYLLFFECKYKYKYFRKKKKIQIRVKIHPKIYLKILKQILLNLCMKFLIYYKVSLFSGMF